MTSESLVSESDMHGLMREGWGGHLGTVKHASNLNLSSTLLHI